jgi:hypothetical protein
MGSRCSITISAASGEPEPYCQHPDQGQGWLVATESLEGGLQHSRGLGSGGRPSATMCKTLGAYGRQLGMLLSCNVYEVASWQSLQLQISS